MGNRQSAGKHGDISTASLTYSPEDLKSVQKTLNFAILTDPHNEFDCNDEDIDDETKIIAIVDFMRDRGFRPITAEEFLRERQILLAQQGVGDNITLWHPLMRSHSGGAGNKRGEGEGENGKGKSNKMKKSRMTSGKENKKDKLPR